MTLEQRLNRLETQNRRLKFGGVVLLLGIGAVFLMGQAKGVPGKLTATELTIVDENGKTRARLGVDSDDVVLSLDGSLTLPPCN